MKKNISKMLSIALCICMICSMLPFASAEEPLTEMPEDVTSEDVFDSEYGEEIFNIEYVDEGDSSDEFEEYDLAIPDTPDATDDFAEPFEATEPDLAEDWVQDAEELPAEGGADAFEGEESADPGLTEDSYEENQSAETDYAEEPETEGYELDEQPAVERVTVIFNLDPETTEVVLYTEGEDGERIVIEAEEDGCYLLLPGEYAYDVSAEGYVPVEEIGLLVSESEEPIEITLALPKLIETEQDESEVAAEPGQEAEAVEPELEAVAGTNYPAEEELQDEETVVTDEKDETDTETLSPELVKVIFAPAQENTAISVYSINEDGEKNTIEAEEDGSYLLLPGEYAYDVSAEGYAPLEGVSLLVSASEEPIEIQCSLPEAEENQEVQPVKEQASETEASALTDKADETDLVVPGGNQSEAASEEAAMAAAPVITKHPASVTVEAGSKVTFTVTATGSGLSYQWQVRANSDANWSNSSIASAKTTAMTFTPSDSINGYQYRCAVTNSAGTVYSNIAYLTVNSQASAKPVITRQPVSANVNVGTKVTLTVAATGGGLSYQWQVRANSDANWSNSSISSAKTTTMVFTPSDSLNGYQYRCAVTNSFGTTISNTAILTISSTASAKPTITRQPASASVKAGSKVSLVVAATGGGLSYQWQVRANSDANWSNSSISSAKTTTMVFTPSDSLNGYQYRCKVTNSYGTAYSNTAILTISSTASAKPTITRQPTSASVIEGSKVTLTVTATGGGLSYQWQVRKNSSANWSNSSISSAKTTTMVFNPPASLNGYQYRCAVTNSLGTTYSNAATLTVSAKPSITSHPENISVTSGEKATFHVTATGNNLSYQWQVYDEPTSTWRNSSISSAKTATLSFTAKTEHNGLKYRCVVTNSAGTVNSNAATLTVTNSHITVGNLIYEIIDDSTMRVYDYTGENDSSLVVPETVEDRTVIEIGDHVFENHTELVEIDLPDTIQVIGKAAFAGCTGLRTMR